MTEQPSDMKLSTFKLYEQAVQAFVGDRPCTLDAIVLGGEVLVVLTWLGNSERGLRKPEYVLPLSAVKHRDLTSASDPSRKWAVTTPLPAALFDGTASRPFRRQFGVQNGPALTLPLTSKH